jgi:hypothetical protein
MSRQIIFGVCDKTDKCDSYFGFFKNEDDAKKEVSVQAKRLKEDLGMMDIQIKDDKAIFIDGDKEINVIVIHSYVVR